MYDRCGDKGGQQVEEERIESEEYRRWKEELRRLGIHQPASDGPEGTEAR